MDRICILDRLDCAYTILPGSCVPSRHPATYIVALASILLVRRNQILIMFIPFLQLFLFNISILRKTIPTNKFVSRDIPTAHYVIIRPVGSSRPNKFRQRTAIAADALSSFVNPAVIKGYIARHSHSGRTNL